MGRLVETFKAKSERVLNMYITAGYPELESTVFVMKMFQENKADIIELGIPYSDPLADGPVIQMSSAKALKNGMSISTLFEQLEGFRKEINLPVILMGYLNPLLQYGFEKFCFKAATIGVDGLIIPDIPMYEYEKEYQPILKKYGLDFIFLVTPETSEERIRQLDKLSSGFLYAVSSSSTTGTDKDFKLVENYLERLQSMKLKNPVLVGFGIKDKQTFNSVCNYANGGIIASAYIKELEFSNNIEATTKQFIEGILN